MHKTFLTRRTLQYVPDNPREIYSGHDSSSWFQYMMNIFNKSQTQNTCIRNKSVLIVVQPL